MIYFPAKAPHTDSFLPTSTQDTGHQHLLHLDLKKSVTEGPYLPGAKLTSLTFSSSLNTALDLQMEDIRNSFFSIFLFKLH